MVKFVLGDIADRTRAADNLCGDYALSSGVALYDRIAFLHSQDQLIPHQFCVL